MPNYEYECCSCGHCFEVRKGFNDESAVFCPVCSAPARKLFHPVPIIYKGSGFYSTDHRPTKWNGEESKEKAKESTEASKTPQKAEAKVEAKAEAKGK